MATCACGDEINENPPAVTAAGGWCIPTENLYEIPEKIPMCSDCEVRMLMMMTIGIDPGRHGENLKVARGGIRYGVQSQTLDAPTERPTDE
jgi:hypothetical protein